MFDFVKSGSAVEIAVWTVNGVPSRLVWEGLRYRVNDTPTRLTTADIIEYLWHPSLTHPLPMWRGWRFQAVNDRGHALVFDVREIDGESWQLVRAWD